MLQPVLKQHIEKAANEQGGHPRCRKRTKGPLALPQTNMGVIRAAAKKQRDRSRCRKRTGGSLARVLVTPSRCVLR